MNSPRSTAITVGPNEDRKLVEAVERGGAVSAPLSESEALIWKGPVTAFPTALPAPVRWVQLPSAGVESWFDAGILEKYPDVEFTSAAGAYACTVAEHALTMLLAGVRSLPSHLRARSWEPAHLGERIGTLRGSTVTIVGAGGIGRALIPMLTVLGAEVVAVNRSGSPVPGAARTLPVTRLDEIWNETDHIVVAAPATPATRHLIGATELSRLKPHAWVINVARGSLVDTEALVEALDSGAIGGVGLDVTDPEPLPDGHRLWDLENAIVTPHDSNPPHLQDAAYAEHVRANVARFVAGQELAARIDPLRGY